MWVYILYSNNISTKCIYMNDVIYLWLCDSPKRFYIENINRRSGMQANICRIRYERMCICKEEPFETCYMYLLCLIFKCAISRCLLYVQFEYLTLHCVYSYHIQLRNCNTHSVLAVNKMCPLIRKTLYKHAVFNSKDKISISITGQ